MQVTGVVVAGASQRRQFQATYRSTLSDVYSYALFHAGGNRALAEEITAETYLQATQHVAKGDGEQVTIGWLKTVARRRVIDHWRREERRRARATKLQSEFVADGAKSNVDLERIAVQDALRELTDSQRLVLTLKHVDGFSVDEIADQIGRTPKAVESMLVRSRTAFRSAYGGLEHG